MCKLADSYENLKQKITFWLALRAKMEKEDIAKHHLTQAVSASMADACGYKDLAGRLYAETKLRLIRMSDQELWELARLTASYPERPVKLAYELLKEAREELVATVGEWINDLRKE